MAFAQMDNEKDETEGANATYTYIFQYIMIYNDIYIYIVYILEFLCYIYIICV